MKFLPVCMILALSAVQAFGGDGKAVYDAKCKMCHKADGAGNPGMNIKPLGAAEVQAKTDAQLKKDITAGVGKMKAQNVTDEQATDLVAYIRSLKK